MNLPTAEITDIAQQYIETSQKLVDTWEDVGKDKFNDENNPGIARQATLNLLEYLRVIESETISQNNALQNEIIEPSFSTDEISDLGSVGISLLMLQAQFSSRLELHDCYEKIEQLLIPMALWVARQGAEILELEPLVDYLAKLANQLTDPKELSQLCLEMGEIVDATTISIQQDTENTARPWRTLNLNRAIVAARSQNAPLMEQVFHNLTQVLPEEAPALFNHGMAQVGNSQYPAEAKAVMEKYHKAWPLTQPLH